ncbi:MAG TPA: SDR family oxidoreductase [Caulobacteraceae bacterium]|jgi:NAD(P)-dependent dehydrogenase (short-subunit alcohol dehydrogenase family)
MTISEGGVSPGAEQAAQEERGLQHRRDASEAKSFAGDEKKGDGQKKQGAMQAGARRYPEPPFPGQHLEKTGSEAAMQLKPLYDAPFYKGSGKLEGKVAIITGGDSGIGRSVAVLFAREGADVAICYLESDEDASDTRAAVEKEGRRCILISGDVADPEFAKQAVRRTLDDLGGLDVLVNNAAFQEHTDNFEDLSEDQFDRTLKTNLYGYFHMAKACVPHMKQGSAIVMTGSVTGIKGNEELLDYSMTKGGIHAFARSLSSHLVDKGIRVNVVAPGPVWTPLNPADKDAEAIKHFGAKTKMRRPAQPEEIAPAYVFLASPQCSSFITGEILPIIGGYAGG